MPLRRNNCVIRRRAHHTEQHLQNSTPDTHQNCKSATKLAGGSPFRAPHQQTFQLPLSGEQKNTSGPHDGHKQLCGSAKQHLTHRMLGRQGAHRDLCFCRSASDFAKSFDNFFLMCRIIQKKNQQETLEK